MFTNEEALLSHLQQLTANLSIPIKSKQNLQTFFATITNIFNAPGLFLFLQKVIVKVMHRVSHFVNKIGGKYAIFFEEILNKLVKENSNYLFGSILYKSIKKIYGYSCPKLDKNHKEKQNMKILESILEDKEKLFRNYLQQVSKKKELASLNFIKNFIIYHDERLIDFQQVITITDINRGDQQIEDQLKRKMAAVLNEGGGYIFMGELKVDKLRGVKEEKLFKYKQKILKYKQEFIYPNNFELELEMLNLQSKNGKEIYEKILKITLFPKDYLLYFVSKQKITDPNLMLSNFEAKFLKYQNYSFPKTYKITQNKQVCSLMVKLYDAYENQKKKKNNCIESMEDKIVSNNKLRKQIIYGQVKNDIFLMRNDDFIPLNLIYKHQSIFIVKRADKKLFTNFTKNLDERKILYVADCPFVYHSWSSRLVAVISHDAEFQTVYQIAKDTASKRLNAFITVYPFIVIKDVSKVIFNNYQYVFTQIYGVALKPHIQQSENGNDTFYVYLKFKGEQESIFTFIFMQGKGVKTQFLNKTKYLEKTLKNSNVG